MHSAIQNILGFFLRVLNKSFVTPATHSAINQADLLLQLGMGGHSKSWDGDSMPGNKDGNLTEILTLITASSPLAAILPVLLRMFCNLWPT